VERRWAVREPQLGDVRALVEAELTCFEDPWPPPFFISEILAEGRFNRVLLDPAGGLVAYLFCAWQFLDLHVLKVAALPARRRQGLGRALMELADRHAREADGESLTLEVRPGNLAAIALYETLGYDRVGRRPRYYTNGDDALIMTKRLRESEFGIRNSDFGPSNS
jgi:ribosomal-protein-alanine N-acetyltransferase